MKISGFYLLSQFVPLIFGWKFNSPHSFHYILKDSLEQQVAIDCWRTDGSLSFEANMKSFVVFKRSELFSEHQLASSELQQSAWQGSEAANSEQPTPGSRVWAGGQDHARQGQPGKALLSWLRISAQPLRRLKIGSDRGVLTISWRLCLWRGSFMQIRSSHLWKMSLSQ